MKEIKRNCWLAWLAWLFVLQLDCHNCDRWLWKRKKNIPTLLSRFSNCCEISYWISVVWINHKFSNITEWTPTLPSINQLSCQWMLSLLASSYLIFFCPWAYFFTTSVLLWASLFLFLFVLCVSPDTFPMQKLVFNIHEGMNQYTIGGAKWRLKNNDTSILDCECWNFLQCSWQTRKSNWHGTWNVRRTRYELWFYLIN